MVELKVCFAAKATGLHKDFFGSSQKNTTFAAGKSDTTSSR